MAAKKNVAVTPAFTGRNVSLSEISQASGIGVATLKRGLLPELLTSVMRFPAVKVISIAITALISSFTRKSGTSTLSPMRRCNYA